MLGKAVKNFWEKLFKSKIKKKKRSKEEKKHLGLKKYLKLEQILELKGRTMHQPMKTNLRMSAPFRGFGRLFLSVLISAIV